MPAKPSRPKLAAVPAAIGGDGLEHLSDASREWVDSVRSGWQVEKHHERVLLIAAEAWDQAEKMRRVVAEEGETYYVARLGAYRARPEVEILHQAQLRLMRALRDLGLDDAPVPLGPLAIRHGNSTTRRG